MKRGLIRVAHAARVLRPEALRTERVGAATIAKHLLRKTRIAPFRSAGRRAEHASRVRYPEGNCVLQQPFFLICVCFAQMYLLSTIAHAEPPPPNSISEIPSAISAEARHAADAGLAAFSKGDMLTARKNFQKLLTLAPDNLTALVNLGSVEYRLKNSDEAVKLLNRAVRIEPDAALAWLTLGVIYYDQDKPDAALAALSRAVLLDPKNARAHNYLAVAIGKKGWIDGAESELQRAIELDPDYAEAHFNLALIYLKRSSPPIELARRHYHKAIDLGAAPDPQVEKELATSKGSAKK